MSKKERPQRVFERVKQLIAGQEAKARGDSQDRQERIEVLWDAITSGKLSPRGDESEDTAGDLKSEIEDEVFAEWTTVKKGESEGGLRRRDQEDTRQRRSSNELVRSLVELAHDQKLEIEYLTQFWRVVQQISERFPTEWEKLSDANASAELNKVASAASLKPSRGQLYDAERRLARRYGPGLIERQFGDVRAAWWRTNPLLALLTGQRLICLDEIFAGRSVDMVTLQRLFGMSSDHFPTLPVPRGRRKLYGYSAVVTIMDALLTKKSVKRKMPARGRPRVLWLSNPDDPSLKTRVLCEIEARINGLSVPEQIKPKIKSEFLKVMRCHLPDSAEK